VVDITEITFARILVSRVRMWKGTVVDELLDRGRTMSATCCAEIISLPTVTSGTVVTEKQNFRCLESDANDGVLYEFECLNIVPNELHEI
jgi:hypothetical protein